MTPELEQGLAGMGGCLVVAVLIVFAARFVISKIMELFK